MFLGHVFEHIFEACFSDDIFTLTSSHNPISSGVGAPNRGKTVAPIDLANLRVAIYKLGRKEY